MLHRLSCLLLAALPFVAAPLAAAAEDERPSLSLERREAAWADGSWQVRYRLSFRGNAAVTIPAAEIELDYWASVSNSRVAGHALPAEAHARWKPLERNRTTAPVSGEGGTNVCREVLQARLSAGDVAPLPGDEVPTAIALPPGGSLWLTLSIQHDHTIHGRSEPLLGARRIELRLGELTFADEVDLIDGGGHDLPAVTLQPPQNRGVDDAERQRKVLHLSPREGGELYYRYPEVATRPGAVVRVGFWYRTRRIGMGECRLRIAEYHDDEANWRRLEGGCDEGLPESAAWAYFERRLTATPATTHLAIDFWYADNESGEAWIDGLTVRPEDPPPERP